MANSSIDISFNGQELQVPTDSSIEDLLRIAQMQQGVVAVEVNMEVVPRESHHSKLLTSGDVVEAVTLVGGG